MSQLFLCGFLESIIKKFIPCQKTSKVKNRWFALNGVKMELEMCLPT